MSGGALECCFLEVRLPETGILISWSGFEKRAEIVAACSLTGVRARRLRGRLERGSWEVGMDSGIGSDMLVFEGRMGMVKF